jgi:integrase
MSHWPKHAGNAAFQFQENPAVVQAIMRHAKLDMTLYYSHSRRKQKLRAQQKLLKRLLPKREQPREQNMIQ